MAKLMAYQKEGLPVRLLGFPAFIYLTLKEWIDGGNLTERVNFAVSEIGEGSSPGISRIVDRVLESNSLSSPEAFVQNTLDAMGPLEVEEATRGPLIKFAVDSEGDDDRTRVVRMLRLIVTTPEFQFA